MRKAQMIGLMLWRGGWLLAGAAAVFAVFRGVLAAVELPVGVRAGIALLLSGAALVLGSLVAERILDLRNEPREEP